MPSHSVFQPTLPSSVQCSSPPSKVLSAAANGIGKFLEGHGADTAFVLSTVGIQETELEDGLTGLDLRSYCFMLEHASQVTSNDNFGLHFGRDFTPDRLGLIGQIVMCSPTSLDSIKNLCAYFPYHQQNTAVSFFNNKGFFHLEYKIVDGLIVERRQDSELTLGMFLNIMRHLAGNSWCPDEVHLEHPKPAHWRQHETTFGAAVYFGMPTNAIVFRELPANCSSDRWRSEHVKKLCEALSELVGSKGALNLFQRVSGIIRSQLPLGNPNIEQVADALGMTRWTMQRRLADEGFVYASLVDNVRKRLAALYLGQTHLPINEVASVLGYAELSAFSRASVRWFDAPPTDVRKTLTKESSCPL